MGSYNAVKAAVVALTETTGHELAAYGVQAHVVCPSYFRTNLMDSLRGADEALGAVMTRLVDGSPYTADDIAGAVLAGIERGDELIVPDDAARFAYELKRDDRVAYDAMMRKQAVKLEGAG
jgi:NAD(P)-dependent dehydrogenase (short-subunit alcohol dehydrogenase family)